MAETGFVRIHWSKDGQTGGGSADVSLDQEPRDIQIAIDPVRGAKLWLDLSPAPVLVQIYEITVLGANDAVLQHYADTGDIRGLLPGSGSWWTGGEGARLLSLGERDLFHIDVAESSEPIEGIRIRLRLVETGSASSLAQAMGDLLSEAKREHEEFANQVDSLLQWQRDQIAELEKRSAQPPRSILGRFRRAAT